MPFSWYAVLPAGAWIVYLADHVVDVLRKEQEYPTPRHRFVKQYMPFIISIIGMAGIAIGIVVVLHFDKTLFMCGLILSFMVLLHLLIVRINPLGKSLLNNKEMAIAILYSLGIYIGPLSKMYRETASLLPALFCFIIFFSVTCINLLMASLIEYDYDVQMGNSSWVRVVSKKRAEKIFAGWVILTMASILMMMPFPGWDIRALLACYLVMTLGHVLIYRSRQQLLQYLAYRKLGELLFWIPGIIYLILR